MKYWFGYLTAAIFGAITWVLMRFGERFSTLVDMVYPYVIRTSESILAQWASGVDFPVWQLLAVALGALILTWSRRVRISPRTRLACCTASL